MTIYKQGDTYYFNKQINKKRIRVSLETDDPIEAEKRAKELELKMIDKLTGTARKGSGPAPTLEEGLERMIGKEDEPSPYYSNEDTRRTARSHMQSLTRILGPNTRLDKIDENDLEKLVAQLKREGNTGGTINRKLSTLQKLLKVAYQTWKVIDHMPTFTHEKESEGRIRVLSYEEEAQVLDILRTELKEPDVADLVVFLVDTGARLGEALRVQCRDISEAQRAVFLWKTKNGKPRAVPLTSRAFDVVTRRCAKKDVAGPFVHLDPDRLTYVWNKVRKAMGLENDLEFNYHALRHTCATRLVLAGVPLPTVKVWMGHESIRTTERYLHVTTKHLDIARDTLEKQYAPDVHPLKEKNYV